MVKHFGFDEQMPTPVAVALDIMGDVTMAARRPSDDPQSRERDGHGYYFDPNARQPRPSGREIIDKKMGRFVISPFTAQGEQ